MRNLLKTINCFVALLLALMFEACKANVEEPTPESVPEKVFYIVTYSSEHGTVPESINVEENTVLSETQLPNLTDDNLSFAGWYDGESKAVAREYKVTKDVTLTARWTTKATCTIIFRQTIGTENDHVQTVTLGTTVKLDANTFTCPPGYKCE